jgi:hypothetical protein
MKSTLHGHSHLSKYVQKHKHTLHPRIHKKTNTRNKHPHKQADTQTYTETHTHTRTQAHTHTSAHTHCTRFRKQQCTRDTRTLSVVQLGYVVLCTAAAAAYGVGVGGVFHAKHVCTPWMTGTHQKKHALDDMHAYRG